MALFIGSRRALLAARPQSRPAPGPSPAVHNWSHTFQTNTAAGPAVSNAGSVDGWPAGTSSFPMVAGDLLIAVAVDASDNGTLTLAGWTQFIDFAGGGTPVSRTTAWWKIADSTDAASGINATIGNWSAASTSKTATLICFRAGTFNAAAPIYAVTGPNNENFGLTSTLASITLAGANDLFVGMVIGDGSSNTTISAPAGYAIIMNDPVSYSTGSGNRTLGVALTKAPGAGATGTFVFTFSTTFGSETRNVCFAIAGN